MSAEGDRAVSFTVDVEDDRSVIRVVGTRDAAVVVAGPGDESIYLPPENFATDPGEDEDASMQSSYGGAAAESPYDEIEGEPLGDSEAPTDSPYEAADGGAAVRSDAEGVRSDAGGGAEGGSAGEREPIGVVPTADGFEIVHPAPVHDVRLLR